MKLSIHCYHPCLPRLKISLLIDWLGLLRGNTVCKYTLAIYPSFHLSKSYPLISSNKFSSVPQSCPTLCDPMDRSTPGLPVHHQQPEFTQTHAHWVGDAIQTYHPLSFPSLPIFNLSQQQSLFKWVSSLEKTLRLWKIEGRRRKGWQRMKYLYGITNSMDMSFNKLWRWWRTGKPHMLQSMGL